MTVCFGNNGGLWVVAPLRSWDVDGTKREPRLARVQWARLRGRL